MAANTRGNLNHARALDVAPALEAPALENISSYVNLRVFLSEADPLPTPRDLLLHLRSISSNEREFRSTRYVSSREWAAQMIGVFTTIGVCTAVMDDGELNLEFSEWADPLALGLLLPFIDAGLRREYLRRNTDGTARSLLLMAYQIGRPVTLKLLIDKTQQDEKYLISFERCDDGQSIMVNVSWREGIAELVRMIIANSVPILEGLRNRDISTITVWEWYTLAENVASRTGGLCVRITERTFAIERTD